ncbi:MAG: hypothetical protein JWM59_661 [Verrucomicrobiales bacterium]|nr:hypothetical protein [Verrucomicrobiales bacterium]
MVRAAVTEMAKTPAMQQAIEEIGHGAAPFMTAKQSVLEPKGKS